MINLKERFKFKDGKVRLLGKDYKLADKITKQQINDFQKSIEEANKKYEPLTENGEELNKKYEKTQNLYEEIEVLQEDIRKKEEFDDSDISELKKLSKRKLTLYDELDTIENEIKEFNKKSKNEVDEIFENIRQKQAEFASFLLDGLTIDYYLENHDDIDEGIVENLSIIRRDMLMGKSNKEITTYMIEYFDNLKESYKESPSEERRGRRTGKGFRN